MFRYFFCAAWPAFLVAGAGVGLVFTLLDPADLVILGHPLNLSRIAVYTLGFILLWALCFTTAIISLFLQASLHTKDEPTGR